MNKNKKEEILIYFRHWLENQDIFKNRKEMSNHLGISNPHFNKVARGDAIPKDNIIDKIAIMTDYNKRPGQEYKPYPSEERKHIDFTEELRKWFSKQTRFKTQKELAEYLGMPYSSLKKYFQGRSFPKGEIREELYELTGINILIPSKKTRIKVKKSPKKISEKPSYELNIDEINSAMKTIEKELESLKKTVNENKRAFSKTRLNEPAHIRFANAFYDLADEILSFRDSGVKDRQKLRRLVSPKDVGYVSSFLKALFDEDKFSDFILFSKYEFEMKGEDHERDA